MTRILLFIQPGCLSCELMRVYLEAREIAFEEHDISVNTEERRAMIDRLQEHRGAGRDVFAFFKHEETPQGAMYAVEVLKELAGK